MATIVTMTTTGITLLSITDAGTGGNAYTYCLLIIQKYFVAVASHAHCCVTCLVLFG